MTSMAVSGVLTEPMVEAWGEAVGRSAAASPGPLPALVLALRGPLGAGKSVLARAVARGAGVEGAMPSPTYNLLFRYAGRAGVAVHHLDLYRLDDPDDVWELGWEELGMGREIVLIEWPERVESLLPSDRWDVHLEFVGRDGDPSSSSPASPASPASPGSPGVRRLRLLRHGAPPDLPPLPAGGAAS